MHALTLQLGKLFGPGRLLCWLSVLCVALSGPLVHGAPCGLPANSFDIRYDVYHESDDVPSGVSSRPALEVIEAHFMKAQTLFNDKGLDLVLVDASRPAPTRLSPKQATLIKTMLTKIVGKDPEAAITQFKSAAAAEGVYNPSRLNVYYVDLADLTGIHFRDRNGVSQNIIVMGLGFNEESFAHELGHAFSLTHVNFWTHDDPDSDTFPNGIQVEYCAEYGYFDNECNFETSNLMWAAREGRTELTTGQLLRAACNVNSTIIVNQDHPTPGDTIDCPDWSREGICPEVH